MPSVHPYLYFNGQCEEAFDHYKSIFGTEIAMLNRYNEVPVTEHTPQLPEAEGNLVMHVTLPISEGFILMGSDSPPGMPETVVGTNAQVSIAPDDADQAREMFAALSDGGQVLMPIEDQFWGALFGHCIDRYGIGWMVNHTYPVEEE